MRPTPSIRAAESSETKYTKNLSVQKSSLNNDSSLLFNTARLLLFSAACKKKSKPSAGMLPEKIKTLGRGELFKKCNLMTREIQAANYKQPN